MVSSTPTGVLPIPQEFPSDMPQKASHLPHTWYHFIPASPTHQILKVNCSKMGFTWFQWTSIILLKAYRFLVLGVTLSLRLELYPTNWELRVLFQVMSLTLISIWPWVNSDLEGKLSRQRTFSYSLPWIWNVSSSDLCLWRGLILYNPK